MPSFTCPASNIHFLHSSSAPPRASKIMPRKFTPLDAATADRMEGSFVLTTSMETVYLDLYAGGGAMRKIRGWLRNRANDDTMASAALKKSSASQYAALASLVPSISKTTSGFDSRAPTYSLV